MNNISVILILCTVMMSTSCTSHNHTDKTVESERLPQVESLANRLDSVASSGRYLFGHHDDTAYGHTWKYQADSSDVRNIIGKYPGMMSWDLGMIEKAADRNLDGVSFSFIASEINAQHKRGGVNTISWHPCNPVTGGDSWDTSESPLLTYGTDPSVTDTIDTWITRAAQFVASLKDDNNNKIPIIFRPWHENSGSWFWWGANNASPSQYINLWKRTREIFDAEGADNVLWAYAPDKDLTPESYFSTYPGDEYVDILGCDIYAFDGENGISAYISRIKNQLPFIIEEAAKRGKISALTETGLEGLEVHDWFTRVFSPAIDGMDLAYVCVWRNSIYTEKPNHFFVPYPGHPAEADFKRFAESGRPIFIE